MRYLFTLLFLLSSAFTYAKIRPQELNGALNVAMELYESGNCEDAFPIMLELVNGGYQTVYSNTNLEYTLLYYAGVCAKQLGEHSDAFALLSRAAKNAEKLNIKDQIPVIYSFLGSMYQELGDYKQAINYYNIAISKINTADNLETGTAWYLLAEAYRGAQDYEKAIKACDNSEIYAAKAKNAKLEIACLTSSGEAYNELGDYPKAIKKFNSGLASARNAQMPVEMANNHLGLGLVYEKLHMTDIAKQNYDEALKLYSASFTTVNIPLITKKIINLPEKITKSQVRKALDNYITNRNILLSDSGSQAVANMNLLIGTYAKLNEDLKIALETFTGAMSVSMSEEYLYEAKEAAISLAKIYYEEGDRVKAADTLNSMEKYLSSHNDAVYIIDIFKLKRQYGFK